MEEKIYYVYFHRNLITNEIFYVGKGKDRRAYNRSNRSVWWKRYTAKYGYTVEIIEQNLTEKDSLEKEISWIEILGRENDKNSSGILINITTGGQGSSGRKMSEKTKQILKEINTGRPTSALQKEKVSNLYKGKFGASHNRSKSVICIETGTIYGSMSEASRKLGIDISSVSWSVKFKRPIFNMHFEISN